MAQPSTEIKTFRERTTRLTDQLNSIDDVLNIIEGAGTTDAERLAFFQSWIAEQQGYDIDIDDLTAAVVALRALRTWHTTNLPVLARMRI
jgi:hypothetical protein